MNKFQINRARQVECNAARIDAMVRMARDTYNALPWECVDPEALVKATRQMAAVLVLSVKPTPQTWKGCDALLFAIYHLRETFFAIDRQAHLSCAD